MHRGNARDITFGVIFAAFSVWIWLQASTFPNLGRYPGPSLFPQVVAGGLLLASLSLIAVALWRWRNTASSPDSIQSLPLTTTLTKTLTTTLGAATNVLVGLAFVALFPILQDRFNGWLALALLGVGIALLLRVKLVTALLVGTATSVVVTLAFRYLLGVPLG